MRFTSILFFLFLSTVAISQPWFPTDNHVFRTDVIPRIDIFLPQDSLDWIYENVESDHEFKALFVFAAAGEIDTITNIGFRLRGNTSRFSAKKSFKISFNTYESGRKYKGLQKMNLNGEHNDPSVIRSFLTWEICENLRLIGSRSNHVDVYINNTFYGLYINVEHIDDEFVDKRFENEGGNLYKCLWPANLEYLSDNKEDYKSNGYTLKTNKEDDNFDDLINLTKVLQDASSSSLPTDLEPIFNVNGFIRYLAIEMFTGHWDAYSYGKNNYYLYNNQYSNKIEFIPYDVDNTFGIDWFGVDWGERSMYSWWNDSELRPLTEKVMGNQTYKDRYSYFVNELITKYADPTTYFPYIDGVKSKIDQSAQNDTYRALDYGWSFTDFTKSYTEALTSNHVTYGLKPYITARINSIKNTIELNSISPIIENIYHNFPSLNEEIIIKADLTDDEANVSAKLYWKMNDGNFQSVNFIAENTIKYLATIPSMTQEGTFKYYIEATDASNNTTRDPYSGEYELMFGKSNSPIVINEFMASNSNSIFDNYGQTDDWIEIYNTGNEAIFLGDKYLSDDFTNKSKWKLPSVTLKASDYYIIWADGDTEQGENHANFKLSKSGESLGLFDAFTTNFAAIDTFTYTLQETDISQGVNMDGDLVSQTFITPGGENENAEIAYITFAYNMNQQINDGNFDNTIDFLDIAGTFNNWTAKEKIVDANKDGILRVTNFGFKHNDEIEYKARINGDWANAEFPDLGGDGNRSYNIVNGHNIIEHWYNDIVNITPTFAQQTFVYPNPSTNGCINISTEHNPNSICIYNLQGVLVYKAVNNTKYATITTENLPSALYLITIELSNGKRETHKVLIQ